MKNIDKIPPENFCRGQEPIEECDIRDKWVV